jgi:DNA gyrase subunit A
MSRTTQPELLPEAAAANVVPRSITEEVQESYLDYAMSVIVGRALPDARDGLKPVHRRVLYAMWNIGLRPTAKFKKSAFVVGEVMAKYHPHGDSAIYDTLVRMAQDFAMRHMLVTGQGNFGSMDGDAAAAMRYTECKLAPIAEPMLTDIDKETVPFVPNYDGSTKEPGVLPCKLPNLLLNGSVGIAVGMATNIPPHNLGELCDAVTHLLENPEATVEDLMQFVKGPDFPTGGIIYNKKDILQAYATGRGGIVMRAKTEIVEEKNGMFRIIVTEVPYQVNKSTLIEKIADLVQEKKIEGIKDLRDESSKDGVRVVIELKKDAYPKKVLNKLFHMTQLEDTFHVNMLALVDGVQPRVLTLKSVLEQFVGHRKEVIRKRTEFDLAKARARAHILEGLKIALDNLDAVIKVIRTSYDRDEAKANLMSKFKLSELQANAILDMRLSQLANLERQKVEDELKAIMALIGELEGILKSPRKVLDIIAKETSELKEKFFNERRTQIVAHGLKEFSAEDLIPNEPTVVLITADGYIKRLPPDTFRTQGRGGKGVSGLKTKEEDVVEHVFSTNTHADLLFFTSRGRAFQLKAYDVPPASRAAKGQALVNFLQLGQGEKVQTVLSSDDLSEYKYLFMTTRGGVVKKTELADFANVRRNGLIAITLGTEDALIWVRPTTGKDDISLVTAEGQSIRFSEEDVRAMGRQAAGVMGIRLKGKDTVVGMDVVDPAAKKGALELLVVTDHGYGKRTKLDEYKVQGRGGSGIITANVTDKTGEVTMAVVVHAKDERDLLAVSTNGQVIRLPISEVSVLGRDTQGVRIMRFKEAGDSIASVTLVDPSTETESEE